MVPSTNSVLCINVCLSMPDCFLVSSSSTFLALSHDIQNCSMIYESFHWLFDTDDIDCNWLNGFLVIYGKDKETDIFISWGEGVGG